MMKKTILLLTIIFTFFLQPYLSSNLEIYPTTFIVEAQTNDNKAKGEIKDTRPWWIKFWQKVAQNFLPRVMTGKLYFSKESLTPPENDTANFTKYPDTHMDYTFRNSPNKLKEQQKGVWFYEVITEATAIGNDGKEKVKYDIEATFTETTATCPTSIKVSDIVYYFYTKGEKILYDPKNPTQPIDYPSQVAEHPIENSNPDSCYEFAYKNIQPVPKGNFLPDGGYNSYYMDATTTSLQYNDSLRLNIPKKYQGNGAGIDVALNNDTQANIETLMLDSKAQEITMNFFQMPQEGKELCGINESIYNTITMDTGGEGYTANSNEPDNILRNAARLWLTPQKWQKKTSITASNNSNLTIVYNQKNTPQTTPSKSQTTNLSMVYTNN